MVCRSGARNACVVAALFLSSLQVASADAHLKLITIVRVIRYTMASPYEVFHVPGMDIHYTVLYSDKLSQISYFPETTWASAPTQ